MPLSPQARLLNAALTWTPLELKYKIREREGTIIIKRSTFSFAAKSMNFSSDFYHILQLFCCLLSGYHTVSPSVVKEPCSSQSLSFSLKSSWHHPGWRGKLSERGCEGLVWWRTASFWGSHAFHIFPLGAVLGLGSHPTSGLPNSP